MMAFTPVWGTGFEMGDVPAKPGAMAVSFCPIVTPGHTGSYCMYAGQGTEEGWYSVKVPSMAGFGLGAWVMAVNANTRIDIVGPTILLKFKTPENVWTLSIGGTLVATGAISVNVSNWHNFQVLFSATRIQTMVEGNLDIDYSGSFAAATEFVFRGWSGRYDDLVIGTGDWPGDIRYDALIPNGDTAVHAWKPNGISLQAAAAAPTVALAAGPGLTGDYHYKVTLVDTDGETLGGAASLLVQPANQVVALSNIPTGLAGTTARKIYRTAAGGSVYKLAATLNDNTTTTYNDSVADGSLGVDEPANVHWDKIDERPASDADFIYIATNAAQDIHTLTDWDATKKVPLFVMQWVKTWKDTADTQQIKLLLKSGISSVLRTSSAHNLGTSSSHELEIHTTNPDGTAWTDADLDALQAGVEAVVP